MPAGCMIQPRAHAGGWPRLNSENAFGWPTLAGFARVGLLFASLFFKDLPVVSVRQRMTELAGGEVVEGEQAHRLLEIIDTRWPAGDMSEARR
jgi:hypothetical protein